jgi:GDP-L-fucose synthase
MKILLFGERGFLGKHVLEFCKKHNIDIETGHRFDLFDFKQMEREFDNLQYCHSDIINFNQELNSEKKELTDIVIIHCAHSKSLINNNIINSNIIKLASTTKSQIVLIGSDAGYNKNSSKKEKDFLVSSPLEDWQDIGYEKRILYRMAIENENLNFLFLIPTSLYGSNFNENDNHLVHAIAKKMVNFAKGEKIQHLIGDGEQFREIIFVEDFIQNMFSLIIQNQKGIFNLGSSKFYKIKDLAKMILEILGKPGLADVLPFDFKFIDTPRKWINSLKARGIIENYSDSDIIFTLHQVINYIKNQ